MPSTPWHRARWSRPPLLLGVLALVLLAPLAAAHVACAHADEVLPGEHQCAVCRHLADGPPLLTEPPLVAAPLAVTPASLPAISRPAGRAMTPARGRSPPGHLSVS